MPELPEVETIKNIINPIVKGKTIADIRVLHAGSILSGEKEFVSSLKGESFLSVSREGKFLLFHLTNHKVVISHLRMEGKYFECKAKDAPEKHDILIYDFTDGSGLRFNDTRKFGILILTTEEKAHQEPPLSELGKEPFVLTPTELFEGLHKKKKEPIKEALLDQKLIAGLGNIYDDEVLYACKINPKRNANSLTKDECSSIIKESQRILTIAIKNGGSTIRSYHPKEGVSGMMQNNLLAYGKGNTPCSRCGFPLRKISIGGRGTVYCPICQPLPGSPLIIGVTGPIASGKSAVSSYLVNKRHYFHIDADAIIHSLYSKEDIQSSLIASFGNEAIKDGQVDHDYLRKAVSNNKEEKDKLLAILYPPLYQEIDELIKTHSSNKILLDIPLLIGGPYEEKCDLIIDVTVSPIVQKERLLKRGVNVEESLLLNKGWPKVAAKKASGLILDGDKDLDYLYSQLDKASYL
jgi:formamidopyrimidine-DNA glycosylase